MFLEYQDKVDRGNEKIYRGIWFDKRRAVSHGAIFTFDVELGILVEGIPLVAFVLHTLLTLLVLRCYTKRNFTGTSHGSRWMFFRRPYFRTVLLLLFLFWLGFGEFHDPIHDALQTKQPFLELVEWVKGQQPFVVLVYENGRPWLEAAKDGPNYTLIEEIDDTLVSMNLALMALTMTPYMLAVLFDLTQYWRLYRAGEMQRAKPYVCYLARSIPSARATLGAKPAFDERGKPTKGDRLDLQTAHLALWLSRCIFWAGIAGVLYSSVEVTVASKMRCPEFNCPNEDVRVDDATGISVRSIFFVIAGLLPR